jgi:hypothetical protein
MRVLSVRDSRGNTVDETASVDREVEDLAGNVE